MCFCTDNVIVQKNCDQWKLEREILALQSQVDLTKFPVFD